MGAGAGAIFCPFAAGGASEGASDWNAPNASSSPSKSTVCFGAGPPKIGNDIACGRGDGGAGHCPGRAAARSMRLSVRWCDDALASFSSDERTVAGWAIFGSSSDMSGREGFEIGRGGEGVRRTDDVLPAKSSKPNPFF